MNLWFTTLCNLTGSFNVAHACRFFCLRNGLWQGRLAAGRKRSGVAVPCNFDFNKYHENKIHTSSNPF